MEEEQLLKEQQEKLAARKKKAAASKPARKKYMTISDFLDPDVDLDDITEQVKEEIMARKTDDGRGGVRLRVGSSRTKSKSGLFDSGAADDQEAIDEQEQGDETLEDVEELQKMADRFGKDVLESLMKGLGAQMSDWAKEKESPLRNAWERAIKKTQNTVAKLAEVKEGGEKLRPDKTSKLEDLREDDKKKEKKKTSKQSSLQERHRVKGGDSSHLNQATKYREQEQKPSRTDSTAVDKNENMPSREEELKDTQILKDKIQQLMELNREALNKRLDVDRELDKEDLYVEEEEEEKEEEVKDTHILRNMIQELNHRDKELDTSNLDEELEDEGEEEEEEEDELDEESLEQLGEDITEEIQKQLEDIGLGDNGNRE